jgi:sulfotransferase
MNKRIFFLMALPRSGNTLFASLINQNPNLVCTANSITMEIMKDLFLLKQTDVFQNFPDHKSLDNIMDSVYDLYYKNWSQQYIIDRSPVMTPGNLAVMQRHFKQPIKCIIIWRDLMDVLASYIKWFENEPTAFPNKYGKNTIEEKLMMLMNKDGAVAKELIAIQNALQPQYKHMSHIIKYEELVTQPKKILQSVYEFLGIEYYPHYFHNLNQFKINGLNYNDAVVGNNMHTIKTEMRLEDNPYKKLIPQNIINKYGHIKL